MPAMMSSVWRGSVAVLVVLHGRDFPDDEAWAAHLATVRALMAEPGARPLRVLVLSDGGGPTARQRAVIPRSPGPELRPGALVTRSRLARGIAAAVNWLHAGFRTYAPGELDRALDYLGVPAVERPALREHLRAENARIGLELFAELS